MQLPFPCKTLLRVGPRGNHTHVELALDLRNWTIGWRWQRAYSGLSDFLNLWTFHFGVPLFTLAVVIRHRRLP